MNAQLPMAGGDARELAIGDKEFRLLAKLVHDECGIVLAEAKRGLVVSRLARRLRELNMADFSGYCRLLQSPQGEAEREHLISALTTNVTRFFREDHHFRALERDILPGLIERARKRGRVRIWSAGCSSGEEPYSIAMELLDQCPDAADLDIRILATDIDPKVIATGQAGIYSEAGLEGVSKARRTRYFSAAPGRPGHFKVADGLRALISFAPLNLIARWPMRGPFDAVFCRNVVIYFDNATQEVLWQRFASIMAPGSHLFIGHSERLGRAAEEQFVTAGITQYRRTAAGAKAPADKI
ncbi:MAG: CheR family methyltransferase [Pararhodobacter sp.]